MNNALSQDIHEQLTRAHAERLNLYATEDRLVKALRRRVAAGHLVCPFPHQFAHASWFAQLSRDEQDCVIMRTLARHKPETVFCGTSAAVAHGLPVHYGLRRPLRIASAYHAVRQQTIYEVVPTDQAVLLDGMLATPLARAVFDSTKRLDFRRALAIADATARKMLLDVDDLSALVEQAARHGNGLRRCLKLLAHADARSESGGESVARALMIELGFALPELQVPLPDPCGGSVVYRADFYWRLADETVVLGELDGREKYANPQMTHGRSALNVMASERLRESRLTLIGRVMRFSYQDLLDPLGFNRLLESFGIPRVREPWDPLG